jgi:hypothetical protein
MSRQPIPSYYRHSELVIEALQFAVQCPTPSISAHIALRGRVERGATAPLG